MGSFPSGFRRDYKGATPAAAAERAPYWQPVAAGMAPPLIAAAVLILASIGNETAEFPEIDEFPRTADPVTFANTYQTGSEPRISGRALSGAEAAPIEPAPVEAVEAEPPRHGSVGIAGPVFIDERYPPPEVPASEGFEPRRYCDGRYVAIGWGHLVVTSADGTRLLCRDWETALENAERVLGHDVWATLDPVRRDVAAEIALMSGALGLARFVDLIDALKAERWAEAAAAIIESTLGCPADTVRDECLAAPNPRRERMAHWMREGEVTAETAP